MPDEVNGYDLANEEIVTASDDAGDSGQQDDEDGDGEG